MLWEAFVKVKNSTSPLLSTKKTWQFFLRSYLLNFLLNQKMLLHIYVQNIYIYRKYCNFAIIALTTLALVGAFWHYNKKKIKPWWRPHAQSISLYSKFIWPEIRLWVLVNPVQSVAVRRCSPLQSACTKLMRSGALPERRISLKAQM